MSPTYRTRPGVPSPLGATWDGEGTNFALYSETATAVELCLFDADGNESRIAVRHRTDFVWHVHVTGVGPGQRYGYRVDGPWEPHKGLRFNRHNVLLDPYAKALSGPEDWSKGAFSYDISHPERDLVAVGADQLGAPRAIVVDHAFDWGNDAPPNVPLRKTIVYEAHVKGLTMRHPDVPPELRGTYLGVASEPVVRHLRELGMTAVELLPIHGFVDDQFLLERGLRNYWGYNSIAFFAPDVRYRAGSEIAAEVRQCKRMVKALHAAGIEVILDVVYNHTAEGSHLGPTFSFRGIDNATYYRLVQESPRHYFDYTGTGNTLNVRHPATLRLLMDSLRYWVEEMHVDGFRFDLAATLARSLHEVDRLSGFFTVIHQDPIIGRVKLIAEPWDVGAGGYQVGQFPVKWAEWNGKYRDTMRAFWRGDGGRAADLGYRLTGSSDLYQRGGRSPSSSVNFITAHDGFTLRDLVSYDSKHNEANGEGNRDGTDDNASWNCGVEGETDDPNVRALRGRQTRNLFATLLLSQGTPMLCGGDEIGRTQRGNNNAYCQDNEISWHDWTLDGEGRALLEFAKKVVRLRREHPLVQRASFFHGGEIRGVGAQDIAWFRHDGATMTDEDWNNPSTSSLAMFMAGSGLEPVDERGDPQTDDDLVIVLNASGSDLEFVLPAFAERGRATSWTLLLDTANDVAAEDVIPGQTTKMAGRSLKLFARRAVGPGGFDGVYGAPTSTYRVQLRSEFGFRDAARILDYLHELGVGAVYSSPYLRAERGSTHGYDVVDHSALNPELGTEDDYRAWTSGMRERGMLHIADFVPNHVGIGSGENQWWLDVLENGESSIFADYFDIEWCPPARSLEGKLLLPVLGRPFGQEVDERKISIERDGGSLWVAYYDKRFPASPRSYTMVVERVSKRLSSISPDAHAELESILAAITHLPAASSRDVGERIARAREKEIIKRRLHACCDEIRDVARAMDDVLHELSSSPGRLERFLSEQSYRLSYWRVATEEVNYRRFFDVNELAAIRMEDPQVFNAAHARLLRLVEEGCVTGLRLDHTDGLYDPQAYFQTLQVAARDALRRAGLGGDRPVYACAEKILEPGEELPRAWAISGTSGYDFTAAINGIWIDTNARAALDQLYTRYTENRSSFSAIVYDAKRAVMDGSFSSEIHVLAYELKRLADTDRRARDFTLQSLVRVLKETIAAFPVYRTYVRPDGSRKDHDEAHIRSAMRRATRRNPHIDRSVFAFLEDVLLLRIRSERAVSLAMRFQQLTGPIMAKGVEDTAFYRYNRLVCLNEVGCDASRFGGPVTDLHDHNAETLARWPLSMTTTTTHDTKRSEDVRARLAVLTEVPEEWAALVDRLDALTSPLVREVDGDEAPSREDRFLFFQTIVGALPFEGLGDSTRRADFSERIAAYMTKAAREAKVRTSWTTPNAAYDEAVHTFTTTALASEPFAAAVEEFVKSIATYGAANSLAQTAVRLASPGVPDIYQGCETWDFSLVDPDNRRLVSYEGRRAALAELVRRGEPTPALARDLLTAFVDGGPKLHVTRTGLHLRREQPALFLEGAYVPIDTDEHVVAFERSLGGQRLVCVVARLGRKLTKGTRPWPVGDAWGPRQLKLAEGGAFRDMFTGDRHEGAQLPLARVLGSLPVAWLYAGSASHERDHAADGQ